MPGANSCAFCQSNDRGQDAANAALKKEKETCETTVTDRKTINDEI